MKTKRLFAAFAAVVMLALSIPLAALATTYATVISDDVLYLRDEPSIYGNVLGRYRHGTRVEVLSTKYKNWTKVKTKGGNVGYMYRKYLSFSGSGSSTSSSSSTTSGSSTSITYGRIRSNGGPVNFRRRASTKAVLLDRIPVGSKVTILYSGSVWTRIKYGGKDGWVMSKFISK